MAEAAPTVSYAQYLVLEQENATKHEFVDGAVYAMAGGSVEHGRLAMAFARLVGNQLAEQPCVVLSSDVRVWIASTRRAAYPDLSVVCGAVERAEGDPEAVVNPTVLVEILSDTTEAHDRGEKFAHYRRLASLREYVLVSQNTQRVEVFRRQDDGSWRFHEHVPGSDIVLDSIGARFPIDELYRDPLASR